MALTQIGEGHVPSNFILEGQIALGQNKCGLLQGDGGLRIETAMNLRARRRVDHGLGQNDATIQPREPFSQLFNESGR